MKKEFNEKKINPISTAINLFDFANKEIDLRGWFYDLLRLFEEVGLVPTLMSARGIPSRTYITVKNGIKRLEACSFKGIESVWIGATPSSDIRNPFKWLMTAHLDLDQSMTKNREVFSLDFDSELIPFTKDKIGALFKRLEGYCGARYGYSMQRPFAYADSSYAHGIEYDLNESHRDPLIRQFSIRESKLITQWSHAYNMPSGKYKTGDLRQIYPYNLLSSAHLERIVGMDRTLEAWIRETNSGTLEKLSEDRWMWSVPEEKIPTLTKELEGSRVILCIYNEPQDSMI